MKPSELLNRIEPLGEELMHSLDRAWNRPLQLPRGQHLILPEETSQDLYFIESGLLGIYHPMPEGEEVYVGFGYAPDFIGDVVALISGLPSGYGIKALRGCQLTSIAGRTWNALKEEYPALNRCWTKVVEQALVGRIDRELDLLTPSPADRIVRLHQRSPHVFQQVPHKYLASYLRMTPETLSRNMSKKRIE
ncbi:MAG: Crp/Fnr family transcriptional regulator [Bacteroidota bacterium]